MISRPLHDATAESLPHSRFCVGLLWFLFALFVGRVLAQFIQYLYPVAWLPAFDRWQGSALPYPLLLTSQVLMIGLAGLVAWRCSRNGVRLRRRMGLALLAVGALYFVLMAVRLMLGLTLLPEHPWFGKPLPALFHLVLAGYILTLGYCYRRRAQGGD